VTNVPALSLQGDIGLVPLLARMGCEVTQAGNGLCVERKGGLEGISVDMGDMPDVVPTLAVVAAFAQGRTEITNIAHLRIKECDRLHAVVTELRRMGAQVEEHGEAMIIHGDGGDCLRGAEIETYRDHRDGDELRRGGPESSGGAHHRGRMRRQIVSRFLEQVRPADVNNPS